jgi:hypothetical protein
MTDAQRAANLAEAILTNPVWQQAWDRLEVELWHAFQGAAADDTVELRGIAMRRWALSVIRAELERTMAQPLLDEMNAD